MPEKWYVRIIELYSQMLDTRGTRQFEEEEILLYQRLCSLISTWFKLQEAGFQLQLHEVEKELKKQENGEEE